MSLFTQLSPEERATYFQELVARRGLAPVIVEKDFWVCWLLRILFGLPDLADHLVFKGGTSLSKVFNAIERFSEDIDLSVSPTLLGWEASDLDGFSRSKRGRELPKLEAACAEAVRERFAPLLESAIYDRLGGLRDGKWLRFEIDPVSQSPVLHFRYPTEEPESYIPREVKLEFGSLTDQRPTGRHTIAPMVAEIAAGEFDDLSADVVALELERTFWEKATILHVEHHRPADRSLGARYSRHYSDFASLWRLPAGRAASQDFELLERVRRHKDTYFRSAWANYETAKPGTLRLRPPEHREAELQSDLDKMRVMFFGVPPIFEDILAALREAEDTINRR